MALRNLGLQYLPVELLYEIQLWACSEHLPYVSQILCGIFKQAPSYFKAQYLIARTTGQEEIASVDVYTRALRYPICSQAVFGRLHSILKDIIWKKKYHVQLPKRLFRQLITPPSGWTAQNGPIPFLRHILETPRLPKVDVNYLDGYALTKAVHARCLPLVELLLDHHACPKHRQKLAVKVAIRQKDLAMLKLLVEPKSTKKTKNKRRKFEDRVQLDPSLLKLAVSVGATDVVDYLYREKGIVPDVQTLKNLR